MNIKEQLFTVLCGIGWIISISMILYGLFIILLNYTAT